MNRRSKHLGSEERGVIFAEHERGSSVSTRFETPAADRAETLGHVGIDVVDVVVCRGGTMADGACLASGGSGDGRTGSGWKSSRR